VQLLPPLIITPQEVDEVLVATDRALALVRRQASCREELPSEMRRLI